MCLLQERSKMLQWIAAFALVSGTLSAYATTIHASAVQGVEWKLSVTEDFNGSVLDGNLWGCIGNFRGGDPWKNENLLTLLCYF